ncbi:rRNA (cytosine-C5-)-methyltransferase RCM1 [Aspergillus clavatus NRRL 1]|uniref:NOL1/NOP2/sun domain protein, putative n=1 Tax=Aspergillus clavatus (strain ATCC 1007 / CBS 513.65 / DSM 816 / NCTC 3887 / NRRL 1 / QM 1276 / 107) TaxID=344612 RepID=A1CNB7_ASPCL|nr:NOL1/NOP2/sun domain protein, putative [Aspergillus clavatus NRRL 1]EAW07138.1 NOL1/NOP2/sun domain protein, putative [Aspergillus clavatus NRRL 1]
MSLYYDAVSVLTAPATGGSFKSRIYNARNVKAAPAQIYALIIEAAKWDILLKEVIEAAGIVKVEPKLTPTLALLLVHDLLLAKNGIAANANHPLRQAIERHKTRLRGEFTKARVRRGCASVADLKAAVLREKQALGGPVAAAVYPRWVRINNVRTTLDAQLRTTFKAYTRVTSLAELGGKDAARLYVDPHVPDLVAVAQGVDFTASPAYKNGLIILQDKASCFPAYLLLGDEPWTGDLLDGCAAPGNKTTHMASLLAKNTPAQAGGGDSSPRIFSMDASAVRSKTLQKMVAAAGADNTVTVLPGQDFLALDPTESRFENVTGLLLDPSCSGSGIIGRDDVPKLALPAGPASAPSKLQSKKRKRRDEDDAPIASPKPTSTSTSTSTSATDENELSSATLDPARLTKLSNLQARIVEHALAFPAAIRVTYSTCSIHLIENEAVVSRVQASEVARARGWRVMRREEQPAGMKAWPHRGVRTESRYGDAEGECAPEGAAAAVTLTDEELEGCLRCWQGDDEGLGGFFVAGFVRDGDGDSDADGVRLAAAAPVVTEAEVEGEDEWAGFSD